MIIHITYKDVVIKGRVIYNVRAIKNIVVVCLDQKMEEVGNEIVLLYQNSAWEEAGGMQLIYPQLFNQVISRLEPVLKRCVMPLPERIKN